MPSELPHLDSPDVPGRKRELRGWARRLRDGMSREDREAADTAIARVVLGSEVCARAGVVLTYVSFGSEVETRPLIEAAWREGKPVAVPRCLPGSRGLEWGRVLSFDDLEPGFHGIEEPRDSLPLVDARLLGGDALALVPGLLYDREGFRLGYGGGYYDRFLPRFPGTSVGLCRQGFLMDSLGRGRVISGLDVSVDFVVSDSGITVCHEEERGKSLKLHPGDSGLNSN